MRVLVLGAGAIGGYFGARLAAAGVDVTFLVRAARAENLRRNGIVVESPLGDIRQPVAVTTEASEPFDAVLLTCKAYDLPSAIETIAPAVGPRTLILPMLNGLKHLDDLDARFGAPRVLGGLCQISSMLTEAGEIRHLNRMQRIILGARSPEQAEFCAALHKELSRGGFEPVLSPNILQDMWEKWVFLATLAGMTCLMRAPVGPILEADEGESPHARTVRRMHRHRRRLRLCPKARVRRRNPRRADPTRVGARRLDAARRRARRRRRGRSYPRRPLAARPRKSGCSAAAQRGARAFASL